MTSNLATSPQDSTVLSDHHHPHKQNALLGTTARGARLISKPATPLLASTVQPDRHRTQRQYVQQGITAQEVLMMCQPAASPLASTARWDRHQAQERSVLLDIIVLEVPMTSRVVPWATRRQQEAALSQAASSNHRASQLGPISSYLRSFSNIQFQLSRRKYRTKSRPQSPLRAPRVVRVPSQKRT